MSLWWRQVKERARRLRKHRHPLVREVDPRVKLSWAVNRAAVSNTGRYCYFRIPKCANSTVLKSLVHYDPQLVSPERDLTGAAKAAQFQPLIAAEAASVDELVARYHCFTFVRNPYARLLSAYLDKVAPEPPRRARGRFEAVAQTIELDPNNPVDAFPRFVAWLEAGHVWRNAHWAPQVAVTPIRPDRLAYVGRVETLDADLAVVIDHLFGAGTFQQTHTREIHRTNAHAKLARFYDDALAERVHALYREDFEAFGYAADFRQLHHQPAGDAQPRIASASTPSDAHQAT